MYRHVLKSTESLPPLPPIKELIGFEQFVWPTHFGLEEAQAPAPPLVIPLHKTFNMIAALRQALYTQTSFCALFFKKVNGFTRFFWFFWFEKEKSLKPPQGVRTQDPPCENGHIFSAECTGLFLNYWTRLIAALHAAGTVHRRRFVRHSLLSPILSKMSPDLHDFYVTLSGSGGGSGPPLCKWTIFFGLI